MVLAQSFLHGSSLLIVFVLMIFGTLAAFAMRYKRCPSDKILVIYGKIAGGRSSRCTHGGAAFVWPIIQAYQFLDLTPIPIDIKLEGVLSKQNIRINIPSTFTVGISTERGVMENAAERLLGLSLNDIQQLCQDIIFGQMRLVIATMSIEEIAADRDRLIENISNAAGRDLRKVGIRLINVNIQDVTDEFGYIDALGKDAVARGKAQDVSKAAESPPAAHGNAPPTAPHPPSQLPAVPRKADPGSRETETPTDQL